jgi:hypothetical protein
MEDLMGGGPSEAAGGAPSAGNPMDDLMGIFGPAPGASTSAAAESDLINGFGGLGMDGGQQAAGQKKSNNAILDLF